MKFFLFLLFMLTTGFAQSQQEITEAELTQHIEFLTAEELKGRYPGTPENDSIVNYLVDDFSKNEISVLVQEFEAQMRKDSFIVKTYNVLGLVEGNDSILKDEVIVLGAHYDHLGMKGDSIYHGADDNASGIAALLEIAEKVLRDELSNKESQTKLVEKMLGDAKLN